MKVIGKNTFDALPGKASGDALKQGAAFNEAMQAFFPGGKTGYIPKGLYRFKTHAEANSHQDICLASHMARTSLSMNRFNG